MNERANAIINWAYTLSQEIGDFEGEPYNDYEVESAWHDYLQEDGEISEIYVGVELNVSDDEYETNPLKLISMVSNAGFNLHSTNVEWGARNLRLSFKYEL